MTGVEGPVRPAPGRIIVFSDIWCAFGHVAVHRLHAARERLGLQGRVIFDPYCFPMELLNGNPGSRPGSDSEVPSVGACEPDAGWQLWHGPDWLYPSSSLPALEAVQAAKEQSLQAAEDLDRALRRAFWAESRCITNHTVILDVAAATGGIDVARLRAALDDGHIRPVLTEHARISASDRVLCSPHLFLPDGTNYANPGMSVEWTGDWGVGYPHVVEDRPEIYDEIVSRSAK
ncbi:MAG: DsbA family protein [Streptosporangiaceae bacterium]|nr:DsbA family protein [Streptosporangiaceae bacterium]MBV9857762.1 DsbA family protein [Streptosporangiaceae bacterium]